MSGIAQPVNDPEIQVLQGRPALGRDVVDIRRIGGIADAIAERWNIAVLQNERGKRDWTALAFDGAAFAGFDGMMDQDRRIVAVPRGRGAVWKPQQDNLSRRLVQIDRN